MELNSITSTTSMAIRTWRVVCWRMLQIYRSVVRPTWQTLLVDSPWPTLDRESAWMLRTPGRWTGTNVIALLSHHLSSTRSHTLMQMTTSASKCAISCPPRSWCTPQSLRCRTSVAPLGTSDEVGSLSQHRWQPASLEPLCGTIFEMLTTVHVSSVSLTGLPSPNWTHLWRELLPSPWRRGVDLAGLMGMTTMPPLTETTVELESGRTSSRSSGTML